MRSLENVYLWLYLLIALKYERGGGGGINHI